MVVGNEDGIRIDRYLSEHYPDLSRSYLQKLLKNGDVLVDGKVIKNNYKVSEGETIFLDIPDATEPEILPENMKLDILYEDKDLIMVNKPKGMVVHPAAGHISGTLVNGLMAHCEDLSGINGILRPGIVHRIDMDTTGVLVACKNDFAHKDIADQLKVHSITRVYYAIIHGIIREDGIIDAPIGRHPTDRKKMSINEKNGKSAVTHYHLLKYSDSFSYIECRLETGRTHQIRVHMASLGHPLLGDSVYGPAKCPVPGLQGQTLHAGILGIRHPRTGEYLEVRAPLPEYFEELLDKLSLK
ncbi:MAG: RluA family pseudouridine synthase [Lachnospiraceae bacterium]|nr:RluA family pseudouridine synthase [Lachnospiraceae bacterium]